VENRRSQTKCGGKGGSLSEKPPQAEPTKSNRGVKNYRETGIKTEKLGTQFWFERFKPCFWYPVFTGKSGTGVPILFNNIYILLKLYIIILGT
jgi:hypothetical protein